MSHNSTLKSDPAKTKQWQQRSRKRLATHSPIRCRKPMRRRGGKPETGSVRDLENQLDDLVRQILRGEQSVCFTDGKPGTAVDPLEVSHLFGRSKRPTRFDVHSGGNNTMMHHSCNGRHNNDKSIYRNEYIRRFGSEAYDDLRTRTHSGRKFTYVELNAMIIHREAML